MKRLTWILALLALACGGPDIMEPKCEVSANVDQTTGDTLTITLCLEYGGKS